MEQDQDWQHQCGKCRSGQRVRAVSESTSPIWCWYWRQEKRTEEINKSNGKIGISRLWLRYFNKSDGQRLWLFFSSEWSGGLLLLVSLFLWTLLLSPFSSRPLNPSKHSVLKTLFYMGILCGKSQHEACKIDNRRV